MKHLIVNNPQYIKLEEGFKEWLSILGYAGRSVFSHPSVIHEFFYFVEQQGINDIKQVDNDTVYSYFDYLKERKKVRGNGAITNSYMNKHLQSIKRFTEYLRDTRNSSFTTDLIAFKVDRPPAVVLHPTEIELLYNAIGDDAYGLRDNIMLGLYYGCGLRRNEGIQLDMSDILFDRQLVYVRAGKNYTERYVPANPKILKDIQTYAQQARPALLVKDPKEPALFISQRGERPDGQSLIIRLKQLQQKTDNDALQDKKIGLHTLRHSIATHLLMQGMKLERVAQFLGHKSIESTQIYTHLAHELQSIP